MLIAIARRSTSLRTLLAVALVTLAGLAFAANEINAKVESALALESRPEADRERDRNRRPLETLNFFGLKDDMRVLELIPGGGWYTRVLAPVLADTGQLYVAIGTGRIEKNLLNQPGFEQVELLGTTDNLRRPEGSRFYTVDDFDFDVSGLDMVLTFRNLHNFDAESRAKINSQVFKSLKSGGLYGVVDHTMRHMEPANYENRRRIDPVLVIKEMLDQGFELVDYTDLHYRADDELKYEVGRRSVSGNTDRFTLLFRKP
ncbi:MAG: methyltransferase [Gammaproteobacteria bacterium]|nr:methyltransferase [Gammaproteobacteria bacterium]NNL50381.1 class I SAM-dependent methyltransferase [Woeseiaceae bacterium]